MVGWCCWVALRVTQRRKWQRLFTVQLRFVLGADCCLLSYFILVCRCSFFFFGRLIMTVPSFPSYVSLSLSPSPTEIGIGLTAFGLAFMILGILLLFDKGLLAMGDLLFLAGVTLLIGVKRSTRFFFQRKKAKGSALFFGGMLLVLVGWPVIGMGVELFGFVNLFGDFFPIAIAFMRRMPIVGNFMLLPGVRVVVDKLAATQPNKLPV